MLQAKYSGPPGGLRKGGFTLVEIVVALTIVAVIAAVAVPTMKGLHQDEKARAPVASLSEIVQEVRHRAMRERRTYQIVFEPGGIHASPAMYPYEKREDFLKALEELRRPPEEESRGERGDAAEEEAHVQSGAGGDEDNEDFDELPPRRAEPPWTVSLPLEPGTECDVLMWGDGEWDLLDGGKMRRWVFQPAGMSSPARVRLRSPDGGPELEAGFDVLTGELITERTRLATRQP